jgi:hypothetical protein
MSGDGYLFFKFDGFFEGLSRSGAILECTELGVHPDRVAVGATWTDTSVLVNKRRSIVGQIDPYLA